MAIPSISKRISSRVYESILSLRAYLALDKAGRAERKGIREMHLTINQMLEALSPQG